MIEQRVTIICDNPNCNSSATFGRKTFRAYDTKASQTATVQEALMDGWSTVTTAVGTNYYCNGCRVVPMAKVT